jgi:predicted dehydrogenase
MAKTGSTERAASSKPIRVGVIGVGRGQGFANNARHAGMELVALCDRWEEKLVEVGKRHPGVATYTDYDKFLEHDMDAVILANYFHEHAPFAVKALGAGMHVMSETSACKTLGEAVELVRAVEKSGKIYKLAENYCYFAYNQEMRRLYQEDEIGELMSAECEYVHPMTAESGNRISPGRDHWRNNIPSTYYCTHALGPIMYITDARPVAVNARAIPYSKRDSQARHARMSDAAATIICKMDNDANTVINGIGLRGHGNWYRLHGTRGLMENLRVRGEQHKLRIVHEAWDMEAGDVSERIYEPEFPVHADLAKATGHGGGDFYTEFFFADAIRTGKPPFLDVYRGLDMTIVGIQAWRSCLDDGNGYEVPDFRKEAPRRKYAKDNWSPFAEDRRKGQPAPSIQGRKRISAENLAAAREDWRQAGYTGR